MRKIRVGIDECDGNLEGYNQCGNAGNLGGNAKTVRNQGDNARNQGRNLSIAVEMT